MALRGVGAIVLGTLAVLWSSITLLALAGIFSSYCVVYAVFSIVMAVRGARRHERWWWPALNGVVASAAAVIALLYPRLTIFAFIVLLTVWALATGTISIVGAFRLKGDHRRAWKIFAGVASLVLGMLLLLFPQVGMFTLTWMVAFQPWLVGFVLLSLAYKLRMHHADRLARGDRKADKPAAASA